MNQNQKQHLTQAGYDRLLAELNELKKVKLPEALARLKEASEQWDISENAEYDDALSVRDLLEARIAEIEKLLDNVEIITKSTSSKINFGSIVTFVFTADTEEEKHTVEIVGSGEVAIDGDIPRISFHSPIGAVLRDKKKGDIVKARMDSGDRKEIKILDVQ